MCGCYAGCHRCAQPRPKPADVDPDHAWNVQDVFTSNA